MKRDPDILCIGSVLWDVIGRATVHMQAGADVPGRITRLPGGVAMNIAMTLRRFGLTPAILTALTGALWPRTTSAVTAGPPSTERRKLHKLLLA